MASFCDTGFAWPSGRRLYDDSSADEGALRAVAAGLAAHLRPSHYFFVDALPLTSPGPGHCGTYKTGWLSGWDGGVGTGCSEEPQAYGRTTGALLEDGGG